MSLFLLIFLLVYGGSHCYFYWQATRALTAGAAGKGILALFLLAMVLAPISVRVLERHGEEAAARTVAYLGYCWMGFIFLFLSATLFLGCYRILVCLCTLVSRQPIPLLPPDRYAFVGCCCLALAICIYGWFEARNIRTVRLSIPTAKLSANASPIRIVQISDVHFGLIVRRAQAERIAAIIREARPDLVVSTGDLVDGHVSHFDGISDTFRELRPPLGMYAVTGNHEFYAGIDQALDFTRRAGFRMLRGETVAVTPALTIAGVDDPAAAHFSPNHLPDERDILTPLPHDRFTLFLKHRPAVADDSRGLFDLQLSGHVHKGQIFPFNLLTWLNYPVRAGSNPVPGGGIMYVSPGTGTWGPPIRFLAPPEVTIIDLVPAQNRTGSGSPSQG